MLLYGLQDLFALHDLPKIRIIDQLGVGNDHEVEFHEIKIQLFQEVEFSIMRSKFLIMNFCKIDQEIELALGALRELG